MSRSEGSSPRTLVLARIIMPDTPLKNITRVRIKKSTITFSKRRLTFSLGPILIPTSGDASI
jgi:hypothetical protein